MSSDLENVLSDVAVLTSSHDTVVKKCTTLENDFSKFKREFVQLNDAHLDTITPGSVNRDREDTEIVISGCPKSDRESTADIIAILEKIAKALKLPFSQSDIFSIYRISLKNKTVNCNSGPGPIIARFTSMLRQNEWISAKKSKRDLKASEVMSSPGNNLIYVNESASPTERKLFSLTKDFALTNNLHKPWMRRGITMLKISDDSAPIKINSHRYLDNLMILINPSLNTIDDSTLVNSA